MSQVGVTNGTEVKGTVCKGMQHRGRGKSTSVLPSALVCQQCHCCCCKSIIFCKSIQAVPVGSSVCVRERLKPELWAACRCWAC